MSPKNAVLYARFSPRRPRKNSNGIVIPTETIATQFDACERFCTYKQYSILSRWHDDALSGKSIENRPGLKAAIEACCTHKATLVAYNLSRIARHTIDALLILEQLREAGAAVVLTDIDLDTNTPAGEMFYTVLSAVYQMQRQTAADATSDALQYLQSQGVVVTRRTHVPYGWMVKRSDNTKMIHSEHEQSNIALMIRLLESGFSYVEVAHELNDQGRYMRKGEIWRGYYVKRVLDRAYQAIQPAEKLKANPQAHSEKSLSTPSTSGETT